MAISSNAARARRSFHRKRWGHGRAWQTVQWLFHQKGQGSAARIGLSKLAPMATLSNGHFAHFVKRPNELDLALEIQSAYYAAQAVYKRPAATSMPAPVAALSRTAQSLFYEGKWPYSHKSAMAVLSRPMAVLSRPMAVLSRGALAASRPGWGLGPRF